MLSFLKNMFQNGNDGLADALQAGAVIVDVRTKAEYQQGHIAESQNIPLDEIRSKTELIRRWNKPVITVCRSGSRSAMAKDILSAAGIQVYNGGAWTSLKPVK
ncbi:sulfurtransferase [Niastella koreensis]|uniref:Rhodanese-like protein n=2 Tax=Niastella koreensis TaxID=354356 RepID=G8TE33_NIAKG|nr:rhodanese-like domain-containing protein [Niastella koreensis]AEV97224.1 Rhodanese-like protein [Niastella koreensis GR20-10]OQP39100.1 sulfurtransferase [Niastella koreensis]